VWCPRGKFSPGCLNCPTDPHASACSAPTPVPQAITAKPPDDDAPSPSPAGKSKVCKKGKFRSETWQECEDCPRGKWQMDENKNECYECPTGKNEVSML
jgi:hypothetical protein